VERSLFKDKDGGGAGADGAIVKHRFLSFLIWQFLFSSFLFFLTKTLLLSAFSGNLFSPASLFSFFSFHSSLLLFSISLFFVSSPNPLPFATPLEILLSLGRLIFVSGSDQTLLRKKVRVSLGFLLFLSLTAVSGATVVLSLCWACGCFRNADSRVLVLLGLRGYTVGLLYGLHYLYKQRWVLRFPIIQRPPFFAFKMELPVSAARAFKFSANGCILSAALYFALPIDLREQEGSLIKFVTEQQMVFFIGSFVVILCWELGHCLHQVLHTKRFVFAPSKGSAAAETNPSDPILAVLEGSTPRSLLQYLAYLDLSMVCENNVDTWRRAAFFEETGETYRRVVNVCLRPLEQLTRKLAEVLDNIPAAEKPIPLSYQLSSHIDRLADSKLDEPFFDSQICVWCARIAVSLTSRSRKEDRFGVAQISGSNRSVVSTLLSCLLAVETLMGKKTNLQSSQLGPAGIKWATINSGRSESTAAAMGKIRGSPLYAKAYALADVLRTSIYSVVYTFHGEMMSASNNGVLDKDWIVTSKPVYGSRELLVYKLKLFLESQVS
ncbi:hypothetical protein M569_10253, partial [Genlisea aurea]